MKKLMIYAFIIFVGIASTMYAAQREFTIDQLKQYNGLNKQPSYIAVDGIVYDVSKVPTWKNGQHDHGKYKAGNDLSVEIQPYPDMRENLKKVPVVGTLKAK